MILKSFTPENCAASNSDHRVIISFNMRTGEITPSPKAMEKIGCFEPHTAAKTPRQLLFHQDEENPENWYIEVVKNGGFTFRVKPSNKYTTYIIRNKKLATEIAESVKFTGIRGTILLAGQPTEVGGKTLWGLLVTTLNNQ